MTQYRVIHRTEYNYTDPVSVCQNEARLLLRETAWQKPKSSALTIHPSPALSAERTDFFGNRVVYFSIEEPHSKLVVEATSRVMVGERPAANLTETMPWDRVREFTIQCIKTDCIDARQYLLPSPYCPVEEFLADFARDCFPEGCPLGEAVLAFTLKIYNTFKYDPEFTTIMTPVHEVLEHRRGVCQDFTHLAISCLRSLGIPVRYVSGYLETQPPPGKEKLQGADASHAWFAVYEPNYGWLEFDPTNGKLADATHILAAWGRDFSDVSPLKGVLTGGGTHDVKVAVDVFRENN